MPRPSLQELRSLDWRQSSVWDVRFNNTLWTDSRIPSPPPPFGNDWFPATNAEVDLYSTKDYDFSGGAGNFQVPSEVQPRNLRLQFADTQDGSLQNWLEDWVDSIFTPGGVRRLSLIVGGLELAQLKSTLSPSIVYRFLVYPTGTYTPVFDSSSQIAPLNANFIVVGFDKEKVESD